MGDVIQVDFRARQVIDDLRSTFSRTAVNRAACISDVRGIRTVQLADFLGVDGWGMSNDVLFHSEFGWWEIWEPLPGHLARMGVHLPTCGEGDSEDALAAARAIGEAVDRLECSGAVSRDDGDSIRGYWASEGDRMCREVFEQVVGNAPWHGECHPKLLAFDGDLAKSILLAVTAYRVASRSHRRSKTKVAERMPHASETRTARLMAAELMVAGFPPSSVEFWIRAAFPRLGDIDDIVRQGFEAAAARRSAKPRR